VLDMQRSKWVLTMCSFLAVTALAWQVNVQAGDSSAKTAQCAQKTAACSADKAADCDQVKACCAKKSADYAATGKACDADAAPAKAHTAVLAKADGACESNASAALASLASCENSAYETVRLTNGVAVVYTVANGCPESTKALKAVLASTCPKAAAQELASKCTKTQELLASNSVVIDKAMFRTGGMILITSSDSTTVAALHEVIADQPVQTAMAR
jgi:hypothetical protein